MISRKAAIGRTVGIIILAVIAAVFFTQLYSGQEPLDFHAFINEKGEETLVLRDWMQEKDIDSIQLLNKSNRRYGQGVGIQTGKLSCYFDGPGADKLFATTDINKMQDGMDKAFELIKVAGEYGAVAYILHGDVLEVKISGNPFFRLGGMEGASIYYAGTDPAEKMAEIGLQGSEDLGNGWFSAAAGPKSGFQVDTGSDLFIILMIIAAFIVLYAIISLLYKKYECTARIIAKKSEYVGHQSRLMNQIKGTNASVFDNYTVYKVTFLTDKNEALGIYVPKAEYDRLYEKAAGLLKYKRLLKRYKYVSFEITGQMQNSDIA